MNLIKLIKKYELVLLIILAIILRLISLNQSLWLDEAISAIAAKNYSVFGLISKFSLGDTHPPLYYVILHLWSKIFGYSEISLRVPSVFFGVLAVYVCYKIGNYLGSKKLAIMTSLFLATAPLHIYYSQDVRMYTLSTLLVSMTILYFLQKKWNLFSFSLLSLGMTDYLPLIILIPLWFYIFFYLKDKKITFKFLKAQIPLFLFLFLWFPIFINQFISTISYTKSHLWWGELLGTANVKNILLIWVKFIIGRISYANKALYALLVLLPTLPIIFGLLKSYIYRKKIIILWLLIILPGSIIIFSSFFIAGISYFRLLFLLPLFYVLISYGLLKTSKPNIFAGVIIIFNVMFSLTYLSNHSFWREDWRGLVVFVENNIKPNEIVLVSYPESFAGYNWYSTKPGIVRSFSNTDINKYKSLYTLDYLMDATDPQGNNYKLLAKDNFKNVGVYNFNQVGQVRYWRKI